MKCIKRNVKKTKTPKYLAKLKAPERTEFNN